jgi:hypothetical protein
MPILTRTHAILFIYRCVGHFLVNHITDDIHFAEKVSEGFCPLYELRVTNPTLTCKFLLP